MQQNCGNYHLKNKTYNNTQIIVTRNSLKKRRSKNNTPLKNKTFECMCGKNNCYIQKFLKSIYIYTLHICTYIFCLWYIKICQTKWIAPTSRGGFIQHYHRPFHIDISWTTVAVLFRIPFQLQFQPSYHQHHRQHFHQRFGLGAITG